LKLQLPYGSGTVQVDVPDDSTVAYPRDLPAVDDVYREIRRAIMDPIGCPPLREVASRKSDAVVVINDITRPTPSGAMLKLIVEELQVAGIREDAVTVVIATGNHRPNTPHEIEEMIGPDLARRLRVINHICEDEGTLTFMETTETGLPVRVNSLVARSSLKVLTGLITPHHVAGYSGGRKSVVPAVAGLETIAKHHSFPIRPYYPAMGWMKGNPFHEEAVKVARIVGIDFIVNVVKNWMGQVVRAVAGDLEAAHEVGVCTCEETWVVTFPQKYDVVVVTPGGYPRDINLHQSQKAMSSAELVVSDDGVIVLVAECRDGIGKFADWLKEARTPQEVIERFKREGFTREHSSKAFMCARALAEHPVIAACSGIGKGEIEEMFFHYVPTPQEAVEMALDMRGRDCSVLVLPYSVDCVPKVSSGG
jgi:nickel-dependent lactate racemase